MSPSGQPQLPANLSVSDFPQAARMNDDGSRGVRPGLLSEAA